MRRAALLVAGTVRLRWLLIVFAVSYAVANVSLSEASHQMSGKTWFWQYYQQTWNPKEIQWQTCSMSDYEYNVAGIALNNWRFRFGRGIQHTYVGPNCDPANDNMLRVWATDRYTVRMHCGGDRGCFKPFSCVDDRGRWNGGCDYGLQRVIQARIIYDQDWLLHSSETGWDPIKQAHIFAHEFGHGMGLENHTACSQPFVMNGAGCTTMVNAGAYPNDVCVPDRLLGYTPLRC